MTEYKLRPMTIDDMKFILKVKGSFALDTKFSIIITEVLNELVKRYVDYTIELEGDISSYHIVHDVDNMLIVHYSVKTSWEENGVFTRGISPARNYIRLEDVVNEYNKHIREYIIDDVLSSLSIEERSKEND